MAIEANDGVVYDMDEATYGVVLKRSIVVRNETRKREGTVVRTVGHVSIHSINRTFLTFTIMTTKITVTEKEARQNFLGQNFVVRIDSILTNFHDSSDNFININSVINNFIYDVY